jgi:hypothetical protein
VEGGAGWAEFDFTVPATGWYELYCEGGGPDAQKTYFVDGQRVFFGPADPDDMESIPKEIYKVINLPLTAGKHTLRIRRVEWSGVLPAAWELRAACGNPAACLTAKVVGYNVVRAGETVTLQVTGGDPAQATTYDLVATNSFTQKSQPAVRVTFPASAQFLTKTVVIPCPEEGVFNLRAQVNGKALRAGDLGFRKFAVVDVKHAPAAPANPHQTLIHDIDCVAQTDNGQPIVTGTGFWEANGATRVTTSAAGTYRESSDNLGDNAPDYVNIGGIGKMLSAFSYATDVPDLQVPYLLEVTYPDDDRRTANIGILENDQRPGRMYPYSDPGSGYETGDWYPLSNQMLTQKVIFWARAKEIRVALISPNPGIRAAAARIRVYRMDDGLTAAPAIRPDGRRFGSWFEEMNRWLLHFGDPPLPEMEADFVCLQRWIQVCRRSGYNYIDPTEVIYQGAIYDSQELEGYWPRTYDVPRLEALLCEKYGMKYVPELAVDQGNVWFKSRVVDKLTANPDEIRTYNWAGRNSGDSLMAPTYNPLHPAIQAKYLRIVGELVDKVGDSPAFGGVSLRLMAWCWGGWDGLTSLNWGYEDWTMQEYTKETGIQVPGSGPNRYKTRFDFLTSAAQRPRWMAWRCAKMLDYYRRLRDRVQQQHPDAVLYLPYHPGPAGGLDNLFGPVTDNPKDQLREAGVDLDLLASEPGISVIPHGAYGRRFSSPTTDQIVFDPELDPANKALGFGRERAFGFFDTYFELHTAMPVDKLGLPMFQPTAFGAAADAGGRNALEKMAVVLADQDSSTIQDGGWGWIWGQAEYMAPWVSEYNQLPRLPFTPVAEARDPVAVWYRDCPDGFYFYAVNREQYAIKTTVTLAQAGTIVALRDGQPWPGATVALDLQPYELRCFRAARGAKLVSAVTDVPAEQINLVQDRLAFCQDLAGQITTGPRRNDLTDAERSAFLANLATGWAAYREGHYWRARTVLSMEPMIVVFSKLAAYPPGQLHRAMPDLLQTESTSRTEVPAQPMWAAADLQPLLAPDSQVQVVDSTTYDPNWQHTQVLVATHGALDLDLQVPVPGRYRLSLGHVAGGYGAITAAVGDQGMATVAEITTLNRPERTVFPVMSLPAGKQRLSLRSQNAFGVYGITLQPVYHPLAGNLWATIGSFPWTWEDSDAGLKRVPADMTRVDPPMTEFNVDATYPGADGQPIQWQFADKPEGFHSEAGVNFLQRCAEPDHGMCYASVFITSPDDRQAQIMIGTDWWVNAYLNGEEVKSERDPKRVEADGAQFSGWTPTRATLMLKKGLNRLVIKCMGGTAYCYFTAYLTDPGDLLISPRP